MFFAVVDPVDRSCRFISFLLNRDSEGVAATAVAALKGGKVVGIVVTNGGSGYTEVSEERFVFAFMVWPGKRCGI